ncbi:MAG: bifunctional DNA-formamidopyrimidine glycosylase/DNA-(apurinic or apyrimidinic site) lyase [Rhodospirillales bacterium]|nr:bifunctional DNA-formamidopyrimidine glycosylase/DNA-(apurinic or apyrimidinic site) lyase [Rhodospirillales bacterium]
MPELPEVETVRRGLAPVLLGHRLDRVQIRRADLRFPFPDGFGQRLTGRTVVTVGRRAKYLLIGLDDGTVLISHLGMSGSFRIYHDNPPPLDSHDHVIWRTSEGVEVRYNDPRRFGFMELTTVAELATHKMLEKIGPEPVYPGLDGPALAARLRGRATPIKAALLDQHVIAGIGNIYVCEALFMAGISPRRKADSVRGRRADKLAAAIREVLLKAIAAGGSSLKDHRQPSGELGYFQHAFQVYGRTGNPCPVCASGVTIKQITQSGRSTFFCSQCQR